MNIALVAHDTKKTLMENLCIAYRNILSKHTIYATGSTGTIIEKSTKLYINKYLAGHLGGGQQLGTQIISNNIDLLIFLRKPLTEKPQEDYFENLTNLCDTHNIPVATNLATAEALLLALDRGDLNWREIMK